MNSADFNKRLLEAMKSIRAAESEYERAIRTAVASERAYKRRQAIAIVQISDAKNAQEREARAELLAFEDHQTVGDLRYQAHLDAGLQDAAKLALRNRGSELSALQSEAALSRAEAEFIRTAPQEDVA